MKHERHRLAGIDTHKDKNVLAVIDERSKILHVGSYSNDVQGFRAISDRLGSSLDYKAVAIEGIGSYGSGIARYLSKQGFPIVEALSPQDHVYRPSGKSDEIDALNAARRALWRENVDEPKKTDGLAGELLILTTARKSAVKESTATANAIHGLIVRAPEEVKSITRRKSSKDAFMALHDADLLSLGASLSLSLALGSLIRRWLCAQEEITRLTEAMDEILKAHYPHMLSAPGVGVVTAALLVASIGDNPSRYKSEAAFAKSIGTCPIPASSGKTIRHRLNRGGNRQANWAVHQIVISRMQHDSRTKEYVSKKAAQGKTKREIIRILKRYVTRELYRLLLIGPVEERKPTRLRELRQELGLRLTDVAKHLDVDYTKLSRLERLCICDLELEKRYLAFLEDHEERRH